MAVKDLKSRQQQTPAHDLAPEQEGRVMAIEPVRRPEAKKWAAGRKESDASLTILLITYNHAAYIIQALESIKMQAIAWPLEIVVADDASSDNTRDLIADFFERNPIGPVRFLDFQRNRGVTRNYQRSFACVTTKYVAVLEGDDYWTDPNKLRKQVEYLEANGACVGCSANYLVGIESKREFEPRIPRDAAKVSLLDSRTLIGDNLIGNFSTCVYRASALKTIPAAVFDAKSYDWIMNIAMARYGPIAFFHDVMSVYRIHASGVWSAMSHSKKLRAQADQIDEYDRLTSRIFSPEWSQLNVRLRAEIARLSSAEDGGATQPLPELKGRSLASLQRVAATQQTKRAFAGRVVRKIHRTIPPQLLAAARKLSPSLLRRLVRKIGKT